MNCHSKNSNVSGVMRIANLSYVVTDVYCQARNTQYAIRNTREKAFSLPEVAAALIILALVSSSVLMVIDRSITSAADSIMRMQAFEVARENMETVLSESSVKETVEYGYSERYPEIQWQRTVEAFNEPITSRMWVQAICSAEYTDTEGQVQKVELTHWLTGLTEQQTLEIMDERKKQEELLAEQGEGKQGEGEQAETVEPDITPEQLKEKGLPPEVIDKLLPLLKKD